MSSKDPKCGSRVDIMKKVEWVLNMPLKLVEYNLRINFMLFKLKKLIDYLN